MRVKFSLIIILIGLSAGGCLNKFSRYGPKSGDPENNDLKINEYTPMVNIEEVEYLVFPQPKSISYQNGSYRIPAEAIDATFAIEPDVIGKPEGYEIRITPSGVVVTGNDKSGVFYAAQTLKQLNKQSGKHRLLRCMVIRDWPDYPNRGFMLDISRDKVPTMETLYELVDMLAAWKINQFQLYIEHTFAYRGHEQAWKNASPMTAEHIRKLDEYCGERFIELVANQNCFGHMNRFLRHPEYNHIAEISGYNENGKAGDTLCPVHPGSIAFVKGLLDELLPNFSCDKVNVGCDETFELCKGKSKEKCEEVGQGQVYLDFVLQIRDIVRNHGREMQFWGDIVCNYPELTGQISDDMICLLWGYEDDHPFAEQCGHYADAGVRFYVCPGTSSWNSIGGRTDNMIANHKNAAFNGLKHGAEGYLNTDWGDYGHWQSLSVSFMPIAYGAGMCWGADENHNVNIRKVMNEFVFLDENNIAADCFYDLGNAYKVPDIDLHNSSIISRLLVHYDYDLTDEPVNTLTVQKLKKTINYIKKITERFESAKLDSSQADLIKDEFEQTTRLMIHGCELGIARLKTEGHKTADIDKKTRKKLAGKMKKIIKNQKKLWLQRNRPGGLDDSLAQMQKLLETYSQ